MTKPQTSCDLPGVISLAEDDVFLRQEQRERGNKLREELIVEIEGLRPGSVPPHPILDSLNFIHSQRDFLIQMMIQLCAAHFEGKTVFK